MKCNVVNNQISFNALVPKSQYSGKPKFSKHQIELLKAVKKEIAEIDKDLFETESLMNDVSADGGFLNYLENKIDMLNELRGEKYSLMKAIKNGILGDIRISNPTDYQRKGDYKALEDEFNRMYG